MSRGTWDGMRCHAKRGSAADSGAGRGADSKDASCSDDDEAREGEYYGDGEYYDDEEYYEEEEYEEESTSGAPPAQTPSPAGTQSKFPNRRAIGIDYGRKRTGLAFSMGGLAPRPLAVLDIFSWEDLAEEVMRYGEEEAVDVFIVGLPLERDQRDLKDLAKDNKNARHARGFAAHLSSLCAPRGVPVYLFDETRTSKDAIQHMLAIGSTR